MKGLCGKNKVGFEDVRSIPMPVSTETYVPVGHADLAMSVRDVADNMLTPKGYVFIKDEYALARDGQRLFGLFTYKNGGAEMGMAVGFRNSYDKSMSAALAIGASVFVCDNLMITGDITIMRKHTKNIKDDMVSSIIKAFYNGLNNIVDLKAAADMLRSKHLTTDRGYELIGTLLGREIITPTIANIAFREWRQPSHAEFTGNTGWGLYNSITEALKIAPPDRILEMHKDTHVFMANEAFINV